MKNIFQHKEKQQQRLKWGMLATFTTLIILATVWLRRSNIDIPKPYGHPYIPLPAHTYTPLAGSFPYCFEVSTHAVVQPDTSSLAEPYWINIHYPAFEADIQLTYKPVKNDKKLLQTYLEDSYKLSMKHHVRAYAIDSEVIQTPHGITATLITIAGQVPTPFQFYTTDAKDHFLRGALYFPTALENDYRAPIIEFIKMDIMHLLETLQWKKPGERACVNSQ